MSPAVDLFEPLDLDAIVRTGHTDHCARRLAWGDGECECSPTTK